MGHPLILDEVHQNYSNIFKRRKSVVSVEFKTIEIEDIFHMILKKDYWESVQQQYNITHDILSQIDFKGLMILIYYYTFCRDKATFYSILKDITTIKMNMKHPLNFNNGNEILNWFKKNAKKTEFKKISQIFTTGEYTHYLQLYKTQNSKTVKLKTIKGENYSKQKYKERRELIIQQTEKIVEKTRIHQMMEYGSSKNPVNVNRKKIHFDNVLNKKLGKGIYGVSLGKLFSEKVCLFIHKIRNI